MHALRLFAAQGHGREFDHIDAYAKDSKGAIACLCSGGIYISLVGGKSAHFITGGVAVMTDLAGEACEEGFGVSVLENLFWESERFEHLSHEASCWQLLERRKLPPAHNTWEAIPET